MAPAPDFSAPPRSVTVAVRSRIDLHNKVIIESWRKARWRDWTCFDACRNDAETDCRQTDQQHSRSHRQNSIESLICMEMDLP
jgi:hypothetical protein